MGGKNVFYCGLNKFTNLLSFIGKDFNLHCFRLKRNVEKSHFKVTDNQTGTLHHCKVQIEIFLTIDTVKMLDIKRSCF